MISRWFSKVGTFQMYRASGISLRDVEEGQGTKGPGWRKDGQGLQWNMYIYIYIYYSFVVYTQKNVHV